MLSHAKPGFFSPGGPFTTCVGEYPSESVHPVCLGCAWEERPTMAYFAEGAYPHVPVDYTLGQAELCVL